jgi:AmmeMemoRadiSam system protein A
MLSQHEKRELVMVARDAIACALKGATFRVPAPATDALAQPCGAFVTIRIDHELRGCIGYIESERSLIDVVAEVAVKAATDDPRFPPMSSEGFEHAAIEVSVLSPLRRIQQIDEIEIGVHGLVVALGLRRGLLLPQVATEYHLDREAFLRAAMQKAGLPPAMWRLPEIEIYVFEAEVVQEFDYPVGA